MKILLIILMALIFFGFLPFGFIKWKKDILYVLGLGAIVGANIYTVDQCAISFSFATFGFDSIIYTLYVFCLFMIGNEFGREQAKRFLYISIGSILFTFVITFITTWSNTGINADNIVWLLSPLFSIVATILGAIAMFFVIDKLKQKNVNKYVIIPISILVQSIINSLVYFGIIAIINGSLGDGFGGILLGSYIGKIFAIICGIISYLIIDKYSELKNNKHLKIEKNKKI